MEGNDSSDSEDNHEIIQELLERADCSSQTVKELGRTGVRGQQCYASSRHGGSIRRPVRPH